MSNKRRVNKVDLEGKIHNNKALRKPYETIRNRRNCSKRQKNHFTLNSKVKERVKGIEEVILYFQNETME